MYAIEFETDIDYDIDCFNSLDSVEVQKEMRDEW